MGAYCAGTMGWTDIAQTRAQSGIASIVRTRPRSAGMEHWCSMILRLRLLMAVLLMQPCSWLCLPRMSGMFLGLVGLVGVVGVVGVVCYRCVCERCTHREKEQNFAVTHLCFFFFDNRFFCSLTFFFFLLHLCKVLLPSIHPSITNTSPSIHIQISRQTIAYLSTSPLTPITPHSVSVSLFLVRHLLTRPCVWAQNHLFFSFVLHPSTL